MNSTRDIRSLWIEQSIAADPRLGINNTLRTLIASTQALAAGLFIVRSGIPELVTESGVRPEGVERVRAAWKNYAGRRVVMQHWCVWPLAVAHNTMGLVYVESADALRMDRVAEAISSLGDLIMTAIALDADATRASDAAIASYLERTPVEHMERERLLLLLDRHEWNLARVSRALGVTRKTIYNKLDKHGIERRRVAKVVT